MCIVYVPYTHRKSKNYLSVSIYHNPNLYSLPSWHLHIRGHWGCYICRHVQDWRPYIENRVEIGEICVGKFVSLRNRYFYYRTFILLRERCPLSVFFYFFICAVVTLSYIELFSFLFLYFILFLCRIKCTFV